MNPAPATVDFLEAVGLQWGRAWQRKLTREIGRGTFVELDGEPCFVGPDDTQDQTAQDTQADRGVVSRCATAGMKPVYGAGTSGAMASCSSGRSSADGEPRA